MIVKAIRIDLVSFFERGPQILGPESEGRFTGPSSSIFYRDIRK